MSTKQEEKHYNAKQSYLFGRELTLQIQRLGNNPLLISNIKNVEVAKTVNGIIDVYKVRPGASRVICLTYENAAKGQNHWIVVDGTGFYVKLYEHLRKLKNKKEAMQILMSNFFCFQSVDSALWSEWFHIHFVNAQYIGECQDYWLRLVIGQHTSNINYLFELKRSIRLIEISMDRAYPDVGFIPVDAKKLCSDFNKPVENLKLPISVNV